MTLHYNLTSIRFACHYCTGNAMTDSMMSKETTLLSTSHRIMLLQYLMIFNIYYLEVRGQFLRLESVSQLGNSASLLL
jgi:hypothetical protein